MNFIPFWRSEDLHRHFQFRPNFNIEVAKWLTITSQLENDKIRHRTDPMLGRAVDDASTGSDSDYSK